MKPFKYFLKLLKKQIGSQNMYSTTEGFYIIDNPNNNSN